MAKVFVQDALNNYDFKGYCLIHYDFKVYFFYKCLKYGCMICLGVVS